MQQGSFINIPQNSDFTFQNIPFGTSSVGNERSFPSTIIGNTVINLRSIEAHGLFIHEDVKQLGHPIFDGENLNKFVTLSRAQWKAIRHEIQRLFGKGSELENNHELLALLTVPYEKTKNHLPITIGEYTDFYSSKNHAFNMGCIIRNPQEALKANWHHLPVGYHGRRSSIVIDGTDIRRPWGQIKPPQAELPLFTKCRRLDYELEMGVFLGGPANQLGHPIKINHAEERVFGFVLLNDWSARDVQVWEYEPLGPFGAKNFATTISPWIITLEALEPHRVELPAQDPQPFPYLRSERHTSFDIKLEVYYSTNKIHDHKFIESNYKHMYWSISQQIAHHSITGCNMGPGDILGSGTISGLTKDSRGCLMEYTWNGKEPLEIGDEKRLFLEDGDAIELRGYAGEGENRIGFGSCKGKITPSLDEI